VSDIEITLPAEMAEWVKRQVETGRHSSADENIRKLIAFDRENEAKIAHMQTLVDEALASGVSDRPIGEVLAGAREKARSNTEQALAGGGGVGGV
jgi:antitoxin ParD1/3/4